MKRNILLVYEHAQIVGAMVMSAILNTIYFSTIWTFLRFNVKMRFYFKKYFEAFIFVKMFPSTFEYAAILCKTYGQFAVFEGRYVSKQNIINRTNLLLHVSCWLSSQRGALITRSNWTTVWFPVNIKARINSQQVRVVVGANVAVVQTLSRDGGYDGVDMIASVTFTVNVEIKWLTSGI